MLERASPSHGGLDLLRHVRASERTKHLAVVVFSPSSAEKDLEASYAAGANSYLATPVDPFAFMDLITEVAHYWCDLNILGEASRPGPTSPEEQRAPKSTAA